MEILDMKVNHVELRRHVGDLSEHSIMRGQRIAGTLVQAQSSFTAGDEPCTCDRVAAGEERDIMTLCDEFLRQIGNDSLGAAVTFWRHPFEKRRDLCDSQFPSPLSPGATT